MNLKNISNKLTQQLQVGWTTVQFKKKNGEIRNMVCTTSLTLIPADKHPKQKEQPIAPQDTNFEIKIEENPDKVFNVYEFENGWRSFKTSQLILIDNEEIEGKND